MEDNTSYDADYYIYVYRNRIVKLVKTRKQYTPVKYTNVKTYNTVIFPEELKSEDLIYNYGFSLEKGGFYFISKADEDASISIVSFKKITLVLSTLTKFEAVVSYLKSSIISISSDDDIYNRILMTQIENYEKNNRDIGSLLKAELDCSAWENYDTLIGAIKLKYSDVSEIFAYIKYQSHEIRNLLRANNFKEADEIIKNMRQKLNM